MLQNSFDCSPTAGLTGRVNLAMLRKDVQNCGHGCVAGSRGGPVSGCMPTLMIGAQYRSILDLSEGTSNMRFSFRAWLSDLTNRDDSARHWPPAVRPAPASTYHAVSIKPGLVCCQASKQFGNMRFLAHKAPRLPLPECNSPSCTCLYTHFSDRRSGRERRRVLADPTSPDGQTRRTNRGRRSTDVIAWNDPTLRS